MPPLVSECQASGDRPLVGQAVEAIADRPLTARTTGVAAKPARNNLRRPTPDEAVTASVGTATAGTAASAGLNSMFDVDVMLNHPSFWRILKTTNNLASDLQNALQQQFSKFQANNQATAKPLI